MNKADLKSLIKSIIEESFSKKSLKEETKTEDDVMNQQLDGAKDGPARATLIYNWVKSNKLTLDKFQQWCASEFGEQ